jgi:hypothetical protein
VPRSKAQKRKKQADRVREGKMALGQDRFLLSTQDLVRFVKDYEENKRAAIARALDEISLDPRTWHRPLSLIEQLMSHPTALLPPPPRPLPPPPPAPG